MSNFEYKVVPFTAKIGSNAAASAVAQQLQAAIHENAREGWVFHSKNSVSYEVQPGCLAGLMGSKTAYGQMDQLVFVRAQ